MIKENPVLTESRTENQPGNLVRRLALHPRRDVRVHVQRDATASRHRVLRQVVDRVRRRGEVIPVDGPDGLIRAIAGPLFYRRFVEGVAPAPKMADRCVQRALASLIETEPGIAHRRNST